MDKGHVLRLLGRWFLKRAVGRRYPLVATYCMTHFCNFYCCMCPFGAPDKESQLKAALERDITTDQWKMIMAKMAKFSVWSCIEGGEPTTRDDIMELLQYAKSLGTFVTLTTNGSLLHKFDTRQLSAAVDAVCCAFDSIDSDAYCKIRGVSPVIHHLVEDNLMMLAEEKIPFFTNPVITKFNVEEYVTGEYFEYVSRELNVTVVTPTIVEPYSDVEFSLLPEKKDLRRIAQGILDYAKKRDKPLIGTPLLYWKQILEYGQPLYNECGAWKSITIQPRGMIRIPCWRFMVPTKEMSALNNNNIAELWSLPEWESLKACHRCQYLACHWYASQNTLIMGLAYLRGLVNLTNYLIHP